MSEPTVCVARIEQPHEWPIERKYKVLVEVCKRVTAEPCNMFDMLERFERLKAAMRGLEP